MYSYLPADKQVYVGTVPPDDQASTPALFLTGKGNLLRDFTMTAAPVPAGAPAGSVALQLVPTHGDRDYDWLVLVVDATSLQLADARRRRPAGRTVRRSRSRNIEENVGLSDREFTFKIPRGADVITDTPPTAVARGGRWLLLAVVAARLAGACATNELLDQARLAEQQQDYDRAVVEYRQAALQGAPRRPQRAAWRSTAPSSAPSQDHFHARPPARVHRQVRTGALELQLGVRAEPGERRHRQTCCARRARRFENRIAVSREGKTQLETIIDHARELPARASSCRSDIKLPASVVFRDASSRDVITALGRLRRHQRRLRSRVPRCAGLDRSAQHDVRGRARLGDRRARTTSIESPRLAR